ncbi:hypothetical protein ACFE04_005741 [Oxalis oulophora]
MNSCENDQTVTPKARKPYTITKQREKWTDEEHQRFLEALKLYGRGWRQIEEHVGSKTAVQIRSHAQKFFSKMVRESSNSTESCIKPLDIPPPRPKKKPLHPYPRKSVDSLRGSSTPYQQERSPSPNLTSSEKNNGSPTSVLSAVGSEKHNGCSSPTSCTTDVQSINLSPVGPSVQLCSGSTSENFQSAVCKNTSSKKFVCTAGGETVPLTSIKLFGKTVSVTDSPKLSFQAVEDYKSVTSKISQGDSDFFNENIIVKNKPSKQTDTQSSLGISVSDCNQMPSVINAPVPWWAIYQGVPVCKVTPYSQTSANPCAEARQKDNEASCTGSNTGSTSEIENREKNSEAVDSQRQQSPDCKIIPNKCTKGFVPYKRCIAERDMMNSSISEERKGQRARVCS